MTEWFEWREAPPGDYAVLGDPIAHSLSPRLHMWAARAAGLDEVYRAIRVPKGELAEALKHLKKFGYKGVNCTVPLKEEAYEWSRERKVFPDTSATTTGAANTLILKGNKAFNTDIAGFQWLLTMSSSKKEGRMLVLGSGGTAKSVVHGLTNKVLNMQFNMDIVVWARREESLAWVAQLGLKTTNVIEVASYDIVVNTTSAGHRGESLPIEWPESNGQQLAIDVNYGTSAGVFLTEAKRAGWKTTDGLQMLIHQAYEARTRWGTSSVVGWQSMFCAVTQVDPDSFGWRGATHGVKRGEVVVLPTETVLGLAADARNPEAVAKVFEIKGRPATNPLIVHVLNAAQAQGLTREWPAVASVLAEKFWPGPLTLVLPKGRKVPDVTTGGLDTVALRVPNHPVALRFLEDCARPLAAPSANLSGELSPTRIEHLNPVIREQVWAVLDGEASEIGIESTVVRVYENELVVLRPGHISAEQLRAATGLPVRYAAGQEAEASPGHLSRHYSPRARVHLVEKGELRSPSITIGAHTPEQFARQLYGWLHELDQIGESDVWIELPPDTEEWRAVRDRLHRMVN